jgi:hypothetical protein
MSSQNWSCRVLTLLGGIDQISNLARCALPQVLGEGAISHISNVLVQRVDRLILPR